MADVTHVMHDPTELTDEARSYIKGLLYKRYIRPFGVLKVLFCIGISLVSLYRCWQIGEMGKEIIFLMVGIPLMVACWCLHDMFVTRPRIKGIIDNEAYQYFVGTVVAKGSDFASGNILDAFAVPPPDREVYVDSRDYWVEAVHSDAVPGDKILVIKFDGGRLGVLAKHIPEYDADVSETDTHSTDVSLNLA